MTSLDASAVAALADEVRRTQDSDAYIAMNGYWLCLVKMANLLPTAGGEHEQMASFLRRLSREAASEVLDSSGTDVLLKLDPPLETILASPREELKHLQASRAMTRIGERTISDPKAALLALFEILQIIRDKREHGFKSPAGRRDVVILGAAQAILHDLCTAGIEILRVTRGRAHST